MASTRILECIAILAHIYLVLISGTMRYQYFFSVKLARTLMSLTPAITVLLQDRKDIRVIFRCNCFLDELMSLDVQSNRPCANGVMVLRARRFCGTERLQDGITTEESWIIHTNSVQFWKAQSTVDHSHVQASLKRYRQQVIYTSAFTVALYDPWSFLRSPKISLSRATTVIMTLVRHPSSRFHAVLEVLPLGWNLSLPHLVLVLSKDRITTEVKYS